MIYFALNSDGLLYNLGDHGDFEAANETAHDLHLDAVWLVDKNEALNWAEFIQTSIEQNNKALEKVSK